MADLSITPADVRLVRFEDNDMLPDGPAAEALNAGEMVRIDTTTGQYTPANGTTAAEARPVGMALNTATVAGATISVVGGKAIVDVGDALDALAYDLDIYLADTDGALGGAATDATVDIIVGRVVAGWGDTAGDKLLKLDL